MKLSPLKLVCAASILAVVLLVAGCAGSAGSAPIVEREQPPSQDLWLHYVTTGETLYSIAFRYEKDFRDLAAFNGLDSSYTIHLGQRLYLTQDAALRAGISQSSGTTISRSATPAGTVISSTATVVSRPSVTTTRSNTPAAAPAPPALAPVAADKWVWPTTGSIVRSFGSGDPVSKGIQISASEGTDVVSAIDGVVVYSGAGLRGYGNLLIVKHDDSHLSAYAYNRELLAQEGDQVRAGQKIATVGTDAEGNNRLYFEIRLDGTPVDPIRYLPRR
jgi:lipoprotein NlpD